MSKYTIGKGITRSFIVSHSTELPHQAKKKHQSQPIESDNQASLKAKAAPIQAKLEKAYDTMLHRVKEQFDDVSKKTHPKVEEVVTKAKKTAVSLGELTEDEAEQIKAYLMRDLEDAGEFLKEAKKTLADWLYFDYKLVEEKFWNTYQSVATQVKGEWVEFHQRLGHAKEYKTGEIIGMGTLNCAKCHETLHFTESSTIPECPHCQGKKFIRKKG
jgi:hypothetical protein